jgi:LPXTG-motif cell wall-anchored protein
MGNKTTCPTCPTPVYDEKTCGNLIKTAVDAKKCPSPVYDQNTCGSLIKSAVDAKKCASIFGIQYNDSNKDVSDVMISLQNLINKLQKIVCSSQLKYKLLISIKNMSYDQTVSSSDEVREQLTQELLNKLARSSDPSLGITDNQLSELRRPIIMLVDVIVRVNSSNGKISKGLVKSMLIQIVNSFCLDYVPPEYVDPSLDIGGKITQEGSVYDKNQAYASSVLSKDGSQFYASSVLSKDGSQTTTTSPSSIGVNSELSSGKISSISTFGGKSNSYIGIIVIVLIVLALGGYFYFKKKNKAKITKSISQQVANFGRQIKAVRRM